MRADTTAEKLFFATVRIDAEYASRKPGNGTAFVLRHRIRRRPVEFLVTNRHVIDGATRLRVRFHRAGASGDQPMLTETMDHVFDDGSAAWTVHRESDIDLAITPLAPIETALEQDGARVFHRAVDSDLAPIAADLDKCDALEDVVFIGYPNGIWDRTHHLPVARRGITATPIAVDFEGRPRFLIDAAVFGGSSGSPVFILNRGGWTGRDGAFNDGQRLLFVGVVGSVYYRSALNEVVTLPATDRVESSTRQLARDREMIDLGIVHKARALLELAELTALAAG